MLALQLQDIVLSEVWRVSDLRKSARYSAPVAGLLARSGGGRPARWSATETAGCQAQQAPAELWLWTMRTTINLRLLERQHQPVAGRVWERPHGSRAPG